MKDDNKETKNEKIEGFISEQIEFQLDSIIRSPAFKASLQMQNFLHYIVRKKLAGKESLLKQYTIAVEALGQSEDFDAETNPLIRIEAGRLRKKLTEYYEGEGRDDFCIISVPVGRYVPKFEKNKNKDTGSKNIADIENVSSLQPTTENGWKKSCGPRLLISCFTMQAHNNKTLKLLHYITDNLAYIMSRFTLFQLISAIPHADKMISDAVIDSYQSKNIADYILTVSIHHLDDRDDHQLVVQLIEADTQEVLWSDSYSLLAENIENMKHDICNKITATVADLLQGVMPVHWARKLLQSGNENIDERYKVLAYYRYYSDYLTNDAFRIAVEACQNAIKKHPDDVVAHIIYCEYCRQEYVYARGVIKDPLKVGLEIGQHAIRLRQDSHEAHYVLGQIWFHLGFHDLCIISFEQSRRLSHHNPQVTFGYAFHLFFMEEWDTAMNYVEQVFASKSSYPDWYHTLPFLDHYRLGKYDNALLEAQQISSPGVFWGPLSRAAVYGQLNKKELAKIESNELLARYPDFERNGLGMLKRYLSSTLLFDGICDGLRKAGIKFENV